MSNSLDLIKSVIREIQKLLPTSRIIPNVITNIIRTYVPNLIIFGIGYNKRGQFDILTECALLDPVNVYIMAGCVVVQSIRNELFFCTGYFEQLWFDNKNMEKNNIITVGIIQW